MTIGTAPSGRFRLVRILSGRTAAACRNGILRGYEFIYVLLALEPGAKVFPARSTTCLLVRVACRKGARFPGEEQASECWAQSGSRSRCLLTDQRVASGSMVLRTGQGTCLAPGCRTRPPLLIWLVSAILAAWMIWADTAWLTYPSALLRRWFKPVTTPQLSPQRISQISGLVLAGGLIVIGLTTQLKIARANLDLNSATNRFSADGEAGVWVGSHTDENAVVMARHVPIVYHYSKRSVVWFPPSSDPELLMEGIRTHKVNYLIVVHRQDNYYLPSDDDCFAPLLKAHPDAFRLVNQAPDFKIFQVVRNCPLIGAVH